MLEELLGGGPLGRILPEALADHFPERLAVILVLVLLLGAHVKRGRLVLQRHHEHLHGRVLVVGRGTGRQLDGRNAQAPYVGLDVVAAGLLLHDLGRHPARSSHERVLDFVARHIATHRYECAHAKVSDLNRAVQAEQNVARLYVTMYVAVRVEVLKTF